MKYFKIILAIIGVLGLGFAVWYFSTRTTKIQVAQVSTNQFVRRVKYEIRSLASKPNDRFCRGVYKLIQYHIDDYASICRLVDNLSDSLGNSAQRRFLSKELFSAYAEKFADQANYVFTHNEWSQDDRHFINTEVDRLRRIGRSEDFLESGSPIDSLFTVIKNILGRYNSELDYINTANNFTFNNTDLTAHFPMSNVTAAINDSKSHLNNLGIVRNSNKVREGLEKIPANLCDKHYRYLRRKVNEWSGMYRYSTSLADYERNLYEILKDDIQGLNASVYTTNGVSDVSSKSNDLMGLLNNDHFAAKQYWNNRLH